MRRRSIQCLASVIWASVITVSSTALESCVYLKPDRLFSVGSRQFEPKAFRKDFQRISTYNTITFDDPNEAWEYWKKAFLEVSD